MRSLIILTVLFAIVLVSCGEGADDPSDSPAVSAEVGPSPTPVLPLVSMGIPPKFDGTMSYEEQIVRSAVVARVSFVSVAPGAEQKAGRSDTYYSIMVFTFTVHEYLKGSGGKTVTALVPDTVRQWPTRDSAVGGARSLISERDTTYDSRQAILFLKRNRDWVSTLTGDQYFLGWETLWEGDGYSIAGIRQKPWLPSADDTSLRSNVDSAPQAFLLDDPRNPTGGRVVGRSSGSSSAPTLALADLRAVVSRISGESAAGDGSEKWDLCLQEKYGFERYYDWLRSQGQTGNTFNRELDSGQAAGAVVLEAPQRVGLLPDVYGTFAPAGADGDYFEIKNSEPTTGAAHIIAQPPDPPDAFLYTLSSVSARPLSAGEYSYHIEGVSALRVICAGAVDDEEEWRTFDVTVSPPAGTAYEAMFDPATDGSAISASSVLKPYTASGADTATVSDISWESGTLKIGIDPVTAHSGHWTDFIDIDGDVALSLALNDATVDTVAKTLSWSVTNQPWEVDDKMMLRIYRKITSVTVTLSPPGGGELHLHRHHRRVDRLRRM